MEILLNNKKREDKYHYYSSLFLLFYSSVFVLLTWTTRTSLSIDFGWISAKTVFTLS